MSSQQKKTKTQKCLLELIQKYKVIINPQGVVGGGLVIHPDSSLQTSSEKKKSIISSRNSG